MIGDIGTVGKGLIYITNIDTNTPVQNIQQIPDITDLFASKAWADSEIGFQKFVKEKVNDVVIDQPATGYKEAEQLLTQFTTQFQKNKNDVAQTVQLLEDTQISDADVKRELNKIKSQDSVFNDLLAEVAKTQAQKQALAQILAKTQQAITTDSATISKDLASIASMYQNLNTTASQFDHAVVGYVKDMESRARERLLRYQYYMAKAYEYRMLKPYPGNLNIDSVVKQIQMVIATDGYPATSAHMDYIKSLYMDSVRQIVDLALTELQNQPPERSLPFYFNLTSSELQQLNQTGDLTLDLAPLIAGLPNEDNRHIADLAISNITVSSPGSLGPVARLRFVVNHWGQSTETSAGHSYNFYFGNSPQDQPFTWGASYTLPSGPLSQEQLSVAGLSLLQSLLNTPGQSPVDPTVLSLFARPGADAVVDISMVRDPATLNAQVSSLQIEVTVDFFRTSSNLARLSVQTADGSLPYIQLDRPDVTGRSDGLGTFVRTFNVGDRVTLTAEQTHGIQQFFSWADDSGKVLTTSPTLTLALNSSQNINAVYAALPTVQYTISGRVTDTGGSGVASVALTLTGNQSNSTNSAADGSYQFAGLSVGNYTVIPSKTGCSFTPPSASFTNLSANQSANFTCQAIVVPGQYTISGRIVDSSGNGVTGVYITLGGLISASTTTAVGGSYQFTGLTAGSYTLTPSRYGYVFSPPSISFTNMSGNQTANFACQAIVVPAQYTISGRIVNPSGNGIAGVTLTLSGAASAIAATGTDGSYSFNSLAAGNYTVTPSKTGYTFNPSSATFNGLTSNQTANFTGTIVPTSPQLQVVDVSGKPGGSVDVPINFYSGGASVAAIQFEIDYDPSMLTYLSARAGSQLLAAGKDLSVAPYSGKLLAIGAGFNQSLISDGTAAFVTFGLNPAFPTSGKTTVACTNVLFADPQGKTNSASGGTATITATTCDCDVNHDGVVNIVDVQMIINQMLGISPATCDLNGDGKIDIVDVQIVVNASLGLGCVR